MSVASVQALEDAVEAATPGTVIEIAPGTYAVTAAVWTSRNGEQANPTVLRAAALGALVAVAFARGARRRRQRRSRVPSFACATGRSPFGDGPRHGSIVREP